MVKNKGVVFYWNNHNQINGSLYYAYEYSEYLKIPLYIINCSEHEKVLDAFNDKYHNPTLNIKFITITQLYTLQLSKTLVLDLHSFNKCKYFLTNKIFVFSNIEHDMFRYNDSREVTYFGNYSYQPHDIKCDLKLNLKIFKILTTPATPAIYVSYVSYNDKVKYLVDKLNIEHPIIYKNSNYITNNIFNIFTKLVYVHTSRDTNNRILIESFFYNKEIQIIQDCNVNDSVMSRYRDLLNGDLDKYQISESCSIVKAMRGNNEN
jgi:hypothetical protein